MIHQCLVSGEMALDPLPGWSKSGHWVESKEALALQAALVSGRPLLLRGEPGTGKTQLARVAAQQLGWPLIHKVINGRSELDDLFWSYDAVDRLGEAQILTAAPAAKRLEILNQKRFLAPGPIWWAFDWEGAANQYSHARRKLGKPHWPSPNTPQGAVLLIDEIDKANIDLPNGLLEAFGQGSFQVPWLEDNVVSRGDRPLLMVLTTNEERELPRAFLRRCLVLQLEYPEADDEPQFLEWFTKRSRVHFSEEALADDVVVAAIHQIMQDRLTSEYGNIRPGLPELIDLLLVLMEPDPQNAEAPLARST